MLAMTWYDWFKAGHVIVAVLWVGGGATLALHGDHDAADERPASGRAVRPSGGKIGERLYTPASLLTLLFGIGLVTNDKSPWDWDMTFVQIALAGLGADVPRRLLLDPAHCRQAGEDDRGEGSDGPGDSGDHQPDPARDEDRRLILLFIVFVMTAKPWI